MTTDIGLESVIMLDPKADMQKQLLVLEMNADRIPDSLHTDLLISCTE